MQRPWGGRNHEMWEEQKGGHMARAPSVRRAVRDSVSTVAEDDTGPHLWATVWRLTFILEPWEVLDRGNKIHPFPLLPSSSISFLQTMSSSSLPCQYPAQSLAQLGIRECLLNI